MTAKFVRLPSEVRGGIAPEEKRAFEAHAAKWLANALSTAPVVPQRLVPAVHALYAACGLEPPRVVIAPSPIVMAVAGGFAAAIWWTRRNDAKVREQGLAWNRGRARHKVIQQTTNPAPRLSAQEAVRRATMQATEQAGLKDTALAGPQACEPPTCQASQLTPWLASELAVLLEATEHRIHAASYNPFHYATMWAADAATREGARAATFAASIHTLCELTERSAGEALLVATDPKDPSARFAGLARELGAEFGVDHRFMLLCARKFWRHHRAGNMASHANCHLSAFRDVLGLVLPDHATYRAWELCAIEGGFRLAHENFCIVSDRPEVLKLDDRKRPHCADGPSQRWRDGWTLYHWHGLSIPADREYVIHSPEQITVRSIDAEQNAELRRVMMTRYGMARFVVDTGAVVVQQLPEDDPIVGLRTARLLRKEVPGDEPILYVDLLNSTPEPDGTAKRYMLRVDPAAYNGDASRFVRAAVASTWRNENGSLTFARWQDYAPDEES